MAKAKLKEVVEGQEHDTDEIEETETREETKTTQDVKDKTTKKIKKAVSEGASRTEAVNVIGEIEQPDPDDKEEVRSYFKRIDEKLDKLLNPPRPEEETEEETEEDEGEEAAVTASEKWYDRRVF